MRACCCAVVAAGVTLGSVQGAGRTPPGQDPVPVTQPAEDPELRVAVERFYATQEAEDIDAYLALWSARAQRPPRPQLEYVFKSGDDTFTGLALRRVIRTGDRARVRLSVLRERTIAGLTPGPGALRVMAMDVGLTFVREDGTWKLWREGTPATDLAGALIDTASPKERDALLEAEPDLVGTGLLNAVSQRASQAAQRAAYLEAEALFTLVVEIAQRIGDRQAEGEALQNVANSLYFRGRYPEALAAYERRLAIERERKDDEAIASALLGIATVRYAFADYGVALDAYREALAIQERLPKAPGLATTLISTGNVLFLQGDFDAAIADYRRSLALSRERDDLDAHTRALEGLGRVFTAQGDFAAALDAFSGVLAEAEARLDRAKQGMALQYVGEIQFKLGNLDEARAAYEASRGHYEAAKEPANVGRVWQGSALTDLVAGRFALAEKEYTESIAVCTGAADQECVPHAMVGLGFAQTAQEKFTAALASYAKAIEAFTAQGKREEAARARVGSAQAYAGKGDLDAALDAAVQARRQAVVVGADDVLWRAMVTEARVLRKKGDGAAVHAARAAVETVQRLQQRANERPGSEVPSDGDAAFATLAVIHVEAGNAAAALATAEQMRLYRLRTMIAPHERDIARGMTPEEREAERSAAANLMTLGAQISRERSLPRPDTARLERLEKAQTEGLAKRTAQQQRLFARLPDLRTWRGLGAAATAADLGLALPADGSVLVAFVADEEDLLTFVGGRGDSGPSLRASVAPISRRVLAERVAALLDVESLRDPVAWDGLAAEFAKSLPPDALAAMSTASAVLVVPDAALWRVPFEALRVGDRYLAERASVTYSGSLTAALQARERAARAPAPALVAVAAPDIPVPVRDRILQTSPGWTLRAAEGAEQEVARLHRDATEQSGPSPDVFLLGAEATEARVRERAADATRLHLAAPFRVNAASPLFSPVLLGGDSADPPNDGLLEAREIVNMELAASVAVLSDGSAIAMRDAARALDAIEWTWRSAGVESVLLARWPADATAAEALLEAFHAGVAAGETAEEALRAARATLREADATSAPYYWAGWLLTSPSRRAAAPGPRGDPGRSRGRAPSRPGS